MVPMARSQAFMTEKETALYPGMVQMMRTDRVLKLMENQRPGVSWRQSGKAE